MDLSQEGQITRQNMLLDIFYYLLKKIEKIFSQSEENMIRKGFMTKKLLY